MEEYRDLSPAKERPEELHFSFCTEDMLYDQALEENWEAPEPLEAGSPLAFGEDFGSECLPGVLREYVEAVSKNTQTAMGLAGTMALGVLAACFQNKYLIEVAPGWEEPLNLYTTAVAEPGERKSAVIKAMTAPLYEYEKKRTAEEKPSLDYFNSKRRLIQNSISALESGKVKDSETNILNKLSELHEQLAEMPQKYAYRLIIDDTTPEKLADIMSQQGGSIVLSSAEGGVFQTMAGRYDSGSSLDVYLKAHAGDPVYVDRIGRESNILINPHLTLLLACQPEIISRVMANREMTGRGLPARFIYGWCPRRVGSRTSEVTAIPDRVRDEYYKRVFTALSSQPRRAVLRGDSEFNKLRAMYQSDVERKVNDEFASITDWMSKHVGAMCRIAALYHCWEHPEDAAEIPIPGETLALALGNADFYIESALRAYTSGKGEGLLYNAKYIWKRICDSDLCVLSRSELYSLCRGRFTYSSELDKPLEFLEKLGYIRLSKVKTTGRPRWLIDVNPLTRLLAP